MTIPRMVGLLIGLTTIGVAVVAMRVEQWRHGKGIQEMQFQRTELQQKSWRQEMELARLRSPRALRERAENFGLLVDIDQGQGASASRR